MAIKKKTAKQIREENRNKQNARFARLKEQGIKTVKVDITEQEVQALTQATGLSQKAALMQSIQVGVKAIEYVYALEQELNNMVVDSKEQGKDISKNRTYTIKLTVFKQLVELLEIQKGESVSESCPSTNANKR